jgi:hypothetical protein
VVDESGVVAGAGVVSESGATLLVFVIAGAELSGAARESSAKTRPETESTATTTKTHVANTNFSFFIYHSSCLKIKSREFMNQRT